MKQFKMLILVSLFFIGLNILAQKPDNIIGKYHLPNKLDIEIYKTGDHKYNGKIIALNGFEDGQKTDINNDDKTKRNTPLVGLVIIKGLEYCMEEKQWINGKIYSPDRGMTLNLKVTEIREKEIEVVGSKYFFWRTLVWKII